MFRELVAYKLVAYRKKSCNTAVKANNLKNKSNIHDRDFRKFLICKIVFHLNLIGKRFFFTFEHQKNLTSLISNF